jgi:glycosyltransferase involved in cell wall biosynthesis
VLYVVNVGWFFVSHRLALATSAVALGDEVHVAATLQGPLDSHTRGILAAAGISFHELHFSRSGSSPFELARNVAELGCLFRRVKPDIVHLITLKPVLLGGIVSRFMGIKAIVLAIPGRGSVFSAQGALSKLRRWLVASSYRLAYGTRTRVIVQNAEDGDYFVRQGIFKSQHVRLIRGSGVDLSRFEFRPEPAGKPVVVLASRMLKEKGVEDFVGAAMELKRSGQDARFVLVGEPDPGNPGSLTRAELAAWADSGAVEWWGFRPDMETVFAESHLVCLPTFYGEGVPKVLIEAAAVGRAIVTTDIPGCRDIVQDGVNGLLVPPRNAQRLASALGSLLSDPIRRREMGIQGARRAKKEFDVRIVVDETLRLYSELGDRSSAKRP